jgi:hypothetical protein
MLTTVLKSHVGNNGLGNLLFTIATGYSTSQRDGKQMNCTKPNGYEEYSDNILRNITITNDRPRSGYTEPSFEYSRIPNADAIDGYFQSERYFIDYRDKILDLFRPTPDIQEYIISKYGESLETDSCSIHVRRGDYLNFPNHHPALSLEYYNKAMLEMCNCYPKTNFLIFSDDIDWCKRTFEGSQFTFIEGEKDYLDLYIMAQCKNNIIANSTFSWWGAWLNSNENKKVIAPKQWFGPAISHNTKDLIPKTWNTI